MKSIPPKTEAVDDAWAAGGEGEGEFDLAGLFADLAPGPAKVAPAPALPQDDFALVDLGELMGDDHHDRATPIPGTDQGGEREATVSEGKSSRSTLRPEQPEQEYVADMMERALSPYPAPVEPAPRVDPVPKAAPSGFEDHSLDFDLGSLDEPPGTKPYPSVHPPLGSLPTPVPEAPPEANWAAEDTADGDERDLDLELDLALGAHGPSTKPSAREVSPPETQRGLGIPSLSQLDHPPAVAAEDDIEIIDLGPSTPPPPPPSAPPPRLAPSTAPRPASNAGARARPAARVTPSLDTPFSSQSTAKLVAASAPPPREVPAARPLDPLELVRERYEVGDYSGALVQAEAVLEDRPDDGEALRLADACRAQLLDMYLARIGDRTQVPRVVMEPDQLRWLSLDHRAGFLLSVIDGTSTIDEILDVSGMAELDTLRTLYDFLLQGVIQMSPGRRRRR
jgi:hypothetical protein